MKKFLISAGLLALLFVCPAFAQRGNWDAVKMQSDTMLVVKTRDGKTVKGVFYMADDSKLTLRHDGRSVDVARDDIKRVHLGKKSHAGAWIGGIGGLFVGGAIGGAVGGGKDTPSYYGSAAGLAGGIFVGRKLGRIKSGHLIYEAP